MSENNVRNIFVLVLILLPLQYILVGIVGYYKAEPWPAFVFPGFKNVYETDQTYQIYQTRFEVYNSSREKIGSMSPNKFFYGIPRSQIDGFTRSLLQKKRTESLSSEAKLFLLENSKRLTNHDVNRLEIIYRRDVLKPGADGIEIDSLDADTIATIEVAFE